VQRAPGFPCALCR